MTNDEALNSLHALNTHFKEFWPPNGYPSLDWAITEIERLRSLVREMRPILEQDIACALDMGPAESPCVNEKCGDCDWYDRSVLWTQRIEAGELDV